MDTLHQIPVSLRFVLKKDPILRITGCSVVGVVQYSPVPISYAVSRFSRRFKLHIPEANYPTPVRNHKERHGFVWFETCDFLRRHFTDSILFVQKYGRNTCCKNRFDRLNPASVIDRLTPKQLFPFVKIPSTGPLKHRLDPPGSSLRVGAELHTGYETTKLCTKNVTSASRGLPISAIGQISCDNIVDNQHLVDTTEKLARSPPDHSSDLPSLDFEKSSKKIKIEIVSPEKETAHTKNSNPATIKSPPQKILPQCEVVLERMSHAQLETLKSFQHLNSKSNPARMNPPTMLSSGSEQSNGNSDSESAEEKSNASAQSDELGSDDEPMYPLSRKRAKFGNGSKFRRKKSKRDARMNYVKTYMNDLLYESTGLETAVAKVTKTLGWDVFPFGANIIGRTVNKKEMESVTKKKDSTEWDLLKEAFVLKHFSEAFKIQKNTKGKWICCKNSIDFVDCEAYLKLFWNIKTV